MTTLLLNGAGTAVTKRTRWGRAIDRIFAAAAIFFGVLVLVLLGAIIVSLIVGAAPALKAFGIGFLWTTEWNPVTEVFGAFIPIYGTLVTSAIAMVIGVPLSLGVAIFLTELCPLALKQPISIAVELLAAIPSIIYGIWGLFVFAPLFQATAQPFLIDLLGPLPIIGALFSGPPLGVGVLTAGLILAIMVVGTNALETQTNYFLNHWLPNLRGTTADKKRQQLPNEPHEGVRVVIIDPRRTVTVNACEDAAGKANVLHLAIESGTDLILFNALMTEIAAKGWVDRDFIGKSTTGFDEMLAANKVGIDEAARVTGLKPDDIRKAVSWIAEHKQGGARRRTMFAYEKGLIWGNDNYRTNGALVNIALATGNVGRPGGGCVRMGGHQEGYVRPSDAFIGKPAPYVDQLLIGGKGGVHHIWACDHFKTTLNAMEFRRVYKRRTDLVKYAMNDIPYADRDRMVDAIMGAIRQGGLFSIDIDIVPTKIGQDAHLVLPAATSGEMNLTSMNGERRMRLTERYMDPPGSAKPDCLIVSGLAQALEKSWRRAGKNDIADKFKGYDWKTEEDAFMDGYNKHADGGKFVTYDRLRAMGTNGFQEPAVDFKDDKIVGTKRLYTDGKFKDGKAKFMATQWRGLEAPGKQQEKEKFPYLVNDGRANHVWQSIYLDQYNDFVMDRWPLPFLELHPDDMKELGLNPGDLVEVYNDNGSTQAMAQPRPTAKRKQSFMLFAYPTGTMGNVASKGVNELIIPNYKQTWANIRKIADAPEVTRRLTFKSQEYVAD